MIDAKSSLSAEELADCIESLALTSPSGAVGSTDIEKSVRRHWPRAVGQIAFAVNTIERRCALLGELHPLRAMPAGLCMTRTDQSAWYTHLLAMSPQTVFRGMADEAEIRALGVHFEQLVEHAITGMLGGNAVAIRFGWPSDCGRPPEFPAAIAWLAQKMGLQLGSGYRPPRRKDGGVDIVAWRPFTDRRTGFPVILTQCTVQRSLFEKVADVDLRSWATWLRLLRDPTTVLAVPYILPGNTEEWNEISQRHIIIDRLRLVELLQPVSTELPTIANVRKATAARIARARDFFAKDA